MVLEYHPGTFDVSLLTYIMQYYFPYAQKHHQKLKLNKRMNERSFVFGLAYNRYRRLFCVDKSEEGSYKFRIATSSAKLSILRKFVSVLSRKKNTTIVIMCITNSTIHIFGML